MHTLKNLAVKMSDQFKEHASITPPPIEGLTLRYTTPQDAEYLKKWLSDIGVGHWFPMAAEPEIDHAVRCWISFSKLRSSLTCEVNGKPVGLVTLYIQAYRKLAHQTEFGIILDKEWRNKGIGSFLMHNILRLAKENFGIELLHLQVYADNPAIRLYKRFGFREFGRQTHWLKEEDGQYRARLFMERFL